MSPTSSSFFIAPVSYAVICVHFRIKNTIKLKRHYKAIKILAVRWLGMRLMHIFTETTSSKKAGWSPGNDDQVSMYNLTVFQIFYWMVGKVLKLIPLKKGSLKVHTLRKFAAAHNAVQYDLYTPNLRPCLCIPKNPSSVSGLLRMTS